MKNNINQIHIQNKSKLKANPLVKEKENLESLPDYYKYLVLLIPHMSYYFCQLLDNEVKMARVEDSMLGDFDSFSKFIYFLNEEFFRNEITSLLQRWNNSTDADKKNILND